MSLSSSSPEQKQQVNALFTIPGLPNYKGPDSSFPPVILTPEAKAFFHRAKLCGEVDEKGKIKTRGQGLIGIAWFGKNEKNEDVIYADLLPAFNKGDLVKEDKEGIPYQPHEHVYTDQPLGGNSGRNHEQFMTIIINRIKTATNLGDEITLKRYKDLYSTSPTGEIILHKEKMLGYGLFKGNKQVLLDNIRGASANINPYSIKYNKEFLYINYFKIYSITRQLPSVIADEFTSKLLKELPLEEKNTAKDIVTLYAGSLHLQEEKRWETICDNPQEKNDALHETLSKLCDLEVSKINEVQEIVDLMKKNINLLIEDPDKQQDMLVKLLCYKNSVHNNNSPLINAISRGHNQIFYYLINMVEKNIYYSELNEILEITINNGNIDQALFIANKIRERQKIEIADDKSLVRECLKSKITYLADKEKYSEIKKIMEENDFKSTDKNLKGTSIEATLFDSFEKIIKKNDVEKFKEFKSHFPDLYKRFLNQQNNKGRTGFMEAALTNSFAILQHLLEEKDPGIDLEIADKEGNTIIIIAAYHGRDDIIPLLLKHGAFPHVVNQGGETLTDHLNAYVIDLAAQNSYKVLNIFKIQKQLPDFKMTAKAKKAILSLIQNLPNEKIIPEPLIEFGKEFPDALKEFLAEKMGVLDNSLLHQAIINDNNSLVEYLLEQKFDVNVRNHLGVTPLMTAVIKENFYIVDILLNHGANIQERDNNHKEFHYYLESTFYELMNRHSFKNIATISSKYNSPLTENIRVHALSIFNELIKTNNFQKIQEFKESFPTLLPELLNKQNKSGDTFLMQAAGSNSFEMLQYLLESKEYKINLEIANEDGNNLLLLSAFHGRIDIINLLLKQGVDKNATNKKGESITNYLNLYLSEVIRNGNYEEIFKILKAKEQFHGINLTEMDKDTMFNHLSNMSIQLLVTFEKDFPDIFKDLLNRKSRMHGDSLLHTAVNRYRPDLVEYLLEKKVDVNAQNNEGETPLMLAAKNGDFAMADLLLKHEAALDKMDSTGNTFADYLKLFASYLLNQYEFKKASTILSKYNIILTDKESPFLFSIFNLLVRNNNLAKIKELKESFPALFAEFLHSESDDLGNNAILVTAARDANFETISFLLRNSGNSIDVENSMNEKNKIIIEIAKNLISEEKNDVHSFNSLRFLAYKSMVNLHGVRPDLADINHFRELDKQIVQILRAAPSLISVLKPICTEAYQKFAKRPSKQNLQAIHINLLTTVENICSKNRPYSFTHFEEYKSPPDELKALSKVLETAKLTLKPTGPNN